MSEEQKPINGKEPEKHKHLILVCHIEVYIPRDNDQVDMAEGEKKMAVTSDMNTNQIMRQLKDMVKHTVREARQQQQKPALSIVIPKKPGLVC